MIASPSLLALVISLAISGCADAASEPSDEIVFEWAQDNLRIAVAQTDRIKPGFYDATLIPDDFEFEKQAEDYGESFSHRKISNENARFLRDVGIVSALAEHCNIQWSNRNFLPMMQWQRARLPTVDNNRYLIYQIGISHGYAMGVTDRILKHWQPDCDRLKSDLKGRLFADLFPSQYSKK